jgi:hypothetical protein
MHVTTPSLAPLLLSRIHSPRRPPSRRRLDGPSRTALRCVSALHTRPRFPISRCTVVTMRPGLPIAILPGIVTELGCVS